MYPGERFNSATHLFGLALAIAGSVVLLSHAMRSGNGLKVLGISVFALSMIALYSSSTLYHSLRGPAKARWAKADRCAVYLMIAGTYTPFALCMSQGPWSGTLLAIIWLLALSGMLKELWWSNRRASSLPLYLALGWAAVFAVVPLVKKLHEQGLFWLILGGVFYTVGVAFYAFDQRWRHAHGVWHLFVLSGTTSHYFAMLNYLV